MCGLFGIVRPEGLNQEARVRSTQVLLALGHKSEERGIDAAGLALIMASSGRTQATKPTEDDAKSTAQLIDNALIIKDAKRFRELPFKEHLGSIASASTVIGHTRWATQGAADQVINASPLLAGALIGTHNGDVNAQSVPSHEAFEKAAFGETDSEVLYGALDAVRGDRRMIVKVLKAVRGRAALAFVDRTRPDRLYLARTALSPLSYAYTQDGVLCWASNPDWFRQIEGESKGELTFTEITLIPEGHLLTINTLTTEIDNIRRFTATVRERDLYLVNSAAYRCFTAEDKEADKALARHKVASTPLPKWPTLTAAPAIAYVPKARTSEENSTNSVGDTPRVDSDELEALCWAWGQFDHHTYNSILDASDEEAWDMYESYRASVKQAYEWGETAPGFVFVDDSAEYRSDTGDDTEPEDIDPDQVF
jgi:hypothetical protein